MGMANHLSTCDKNPDNIHQVDIFFGDRTFYKTVTVKAVDMDDALESVQIPKGGYAKPTK